MTALSDALDAAQRRSLAALQKAYHAGQLDAETCVTKLNACGITDPVDIGLLVANLDVLREHGAELPAEPKPTTDEPASDKQLAYIAKLCDEKGVVAPDPPLSKAQASEIIDQLQAGSYDPDKWTVPF